MSLYKEDSRTQPQTPLGRRFGFFSHPLPSSVGLFSMTLSPPCFWPSSKMEIMCLWLITFSELSHITLSLPRHSLVRILQRLVPLKIPHEHACLFTSLLFIQLLLLCNLENIASSQIANQSQEQNNCRCRGIVTIYQCWSRTGPLHILTPRQQWDYYPAFQSDLKLWEVREIKLNKAFNFCLGWGWTSVSIVLLSWYVSYGFNSCDKYQD